jgi:hypothetical protein
MNVSLMLIMTATRMIVTQMTTTQAMGAALLAVGSKAQLALLAMYL